MPAQAPPPLPEPTLLSSFCGPADRAGLARCMELAGQVCQQLGASEEDRYAVQLAVEEACTNIVDHAYAAGAPGPLCLQFWLATHEGMHDLTILIEDAAPSFDPASAPTPDLGASVEDRPVGGLGWFLIQNVMDEVAHAALSPTGNRLRLRKRLAQPAA